MFLAISLEKNFFDVELEEMDGRLALNAYSILYIYTFIYVGLLNKMFIVKTRSIEHLRQGIQ